MAGGGSRKWEAMVASVGKGMEGKERLTISGEASAQSTVARAHLDHAREVAGVGELEHDVQLVVLDERGQVLDHVRVVQLLRAQRFQ